MGKNVGDRHSTEHYWLNGKYCTDGLYFRTLIQRYHEILERGELEKASNIKDLRFLLNEIFNQDNTAYTSYEFSVTTISSHWLVKGRVSSGAKIGDFIFEILCVQRIEAGNISPPHLSVALYGRGT